MIIQGRPTPLGRPCFDMQRNKPLARVCRVGNNYIPLQVENDKIDNLIDNK